MEGIEKSMNEKLWKESQEKDDPLPCCCCLFIHDHASQPANSLNLSIVDHIVDASQNYPPPPFHIVSYIYIMAPPLVLKGIETSSRSGFRVCYIYV
jgi:hypothetical protein